MDCFKKNLLDLLSQDARISLEDAAAALETTVERVSNALEELEADQVILRYQPLINRDKIGSVQALLEVKITPQRDLGYDTIAERIYAFPEVKDCYLAAGGYDLMVLVEGGSMQEVAYFAAEKLAVQEGVLSCSTHFVLKTYKKSGVPMQHHGQDKRLVVIP